MWIICHCHNYTDHSYCSQIMRFKDDLQRHLYYVSQIDYCYFCLTKVYEEEDNFDRNKTLNRLIDRATGYDKAEFERTVKNVLYWTMVIIRSKKAIGWDYSLDKDFEKKIKLLVRKTNRS